MAPKNQKKDNKPQNKGGGGGGAPAKNHTSAGVVITPEKPKEEPKSKEESPAPAPTSEKTKEEQTPAEQAARQLPGFRKKAGEDQEYSYAGSGEGMRSNTDTRSILLEFFQANPGQSFTYKELAHKLKDQGITAHKAWCGTRDLEDLEDLVETKKGNAKAHMLKPQED